jgi:predicted nucleotidyltransferase
MPTRSQQFHLIIPKGTKVVSRHDRRVGVIVHAPATLENAYRVRFPDGAEASFRRADLTIFRQDQEVIPGQVDHSELDRFVAYRCIVGSTAYGLATETSDVDRRGFYLPPADLEWSLAGVPPQLENENEEVYWELEKFLRLALKANPNALECLYSPLVEFSTPVAQELLAIRHIFLSQHVHRTYNAYVLSQFKKLEQDLRNEGQFRWKHVMHLIRLLLSGVTVLRQGFVPLGVEQYRDRLLAIRSGQTDWDEVEKWRLALHRELDEALAATALPEHPDYHRANQFLIGARRLAASPEYGA